MAVLLQQLTSSAPATDIRRSIVWSDSVATYKGKLIRFQDALSYPKPLRAGGPPIYVGGESAAALRRTARFGDGWYGWNMTPDEFARTLDALAAQLRQHSFWDGTVRHLDDLTLQVGIHFTGAFGDLPALLERYHALGIGRALLRIDLPANDQERVLSELAVALHLTQAAPI